MGSAGKTLRLFNALNGSELRQSIIESHRQTMMNDTNLSLSTTFPVVEYETVTTIRAYPREPAEFKTTSKGAFEVEGFKPDENEKPVVLVTKSGRKIEAPDQEREELGLGIPTPVNEAGVIIDKNIVRNRR